MPIRTIVKLYNLSKEPVPSLQRPQQCSTLYAMAVDVRETDRIDLPHSLMAMATLTLTQTQAMGRLHLRLIGKERRTSDILIDDVGAGSKKIRVKRGKKYTPRQIIWMCIILSGVIFICTWVFKTFNKTETIGTSSYDTSATASLPDSHTPIEANDSEPEDAKEQNRRLRLSPEQIRRNTLPDKVLECCRSLVRAGNLNCNKCGKYMHEN